MPDVGSYFPSLRARTLIQINRQESRYRTIGIEGRSAMLDLMLVYPNPFAMIAEARAAKRATRSLRLSTAAVR
jgi:hypothetical protein